VAGTAPSADGGYAHYGAAKAAIAHYTRYLAQDLGPFGITANCIASDVIATGRSWSSWRPTCPTMWPALWSRSMVGWCGD